MNREHVVGTRASYFKVTVRWLYVNTCLVVQYLLDLSKDTFYVSKTVDRPNRPTTEKGNQRSDPGNDHGQDRARRTIFNELF
jgi:hypothetical protein